MTTKDWLKLNPRHRVTLSYEPDDSVRAVLFGGEGVDQHLVGVGLNEALALGNALQTRLAIKSALP